MTARVFVDTNVLVQIVNPFLISPQDGLAGS
jgi:hypothetical protein